MKRLPKQLTYANVMSTIAVFLTLGGAAAVAADQLSKNSVGPKQLKKNAVTAPKIKNGAVTAAKIKDGSLLGADFAAGQLPAGPKGETGPKGEVGPTFGRSAEGGCNPSSASFVSCATVDAVQLPTSGRVLLVGASSWDNDESAAPNAGNCQLEVDGTQVGPQVDAGELTTTHGIGEGGSIAVTAVSEPLSAGAHTFSLNCNETEANMFYTDTTLSAVLLGGS